MFYINKDSIEKVDNSTYKNFRKPLNESYCFSNIPECIQNIFESNYNGNLPEACCQLHNKGYRKVVLLFLDAFGWRFFEKYAVQKKNKLLLEVIDSAIASKITSQFPSTTAAHITTIHTGLSIAQSGIYEWQYYDSVAQEVIMPLLHSTPDNKERNSLQNIQASELYPESKLYKELKNKNIKSYVSIYKDYLLSSSQKVFCKHAHLLPFQSYASALKQLTELINSSREKAYFFFYYGDFDYTLHEHGPGSPEEEQAALKMFQYIYEFHSQLKQDPETALIITTDHGQVNTSPEKTIYLKQECPEILKYVKKDIHGKYLGNIGSARDRFLHVTNTEAVIKILSEKISHTADVLPTRELIEQNFWGSEDTFSERFKENLGDIVVLPKGDSMIGWEEKEDFKGHHGGLTPEEMDTVFIFKSLA